MEIITISVQQLNALLDSKVQVILDAIVPNKSGQSSDHWFNLNDLIAYLPSKPTPKTVYGWVHKKIIPYHKVPGQKPLQFLRSEIDLWMKQGRRKTLYEKAAAADKYLSKTKSPNKKT